MLMYEALLFRHVDVNIGAGYNATTGIFTAPRTGLYAFNLNVRTYTSGEKVDVNILTNDEIIGGIYANDKDTGDQSSVSVAVRLVGGHTVWPVNRDL